MASIVPAEIRNEVRDDLWRRAGELGWSHLNDAEKGRYYEAWTREAGVGGLLSKFMDSRKTRVYIKDSLMKPYERSRLILSEATVWRLLDIASPVEVQERYIKPHGACLIDGRVVCWGKGRDWKSLLMATFERASLRRKATAYGVVLLDAGNMLDVEMRNVIKAAAEGLKIQRLEWRE